MFSAWIAENFLSLQIGFLIIAGFGVWHLHSNHTPKSGFRVRESDLKERAGPASPGDSGSAPPLRLTGINIHAPAHEILGVKPDASPREIQKAYRDLMKRYHPDKIGPAGSPQWQEAQKVAAAIADAKEKLSKK